MARDTAAATTPASADTRRRELDGRVAVVTGGAKGIGRLVAELMAREGAAVVVAGRDQGAIDAVVGELNGASTEGRVIGMRCDVTSEDDTKALVAQALEAFGRVDILVNSAGGTGPIETPCHEYPADEFRNILELNMVGTFLPCKAVIPAMIANGSGRIVNIAGTSGLRGYRNRSGYSASKWAVRGFTRTLALELGQYGITVNDVCPNVTNGARMDRIVATKAARSGSTADEVYAEFASQTALGRFVDEIDVAEAVLFLASDRAKNITGHDIVVDAGWDV
jgi:NAD(P)-dependent dehydrogenase (short-subunit alcohol dehydrogenase family)